HVRVDAVLTGPNGYPLVEHALDREPTGHFAGTILSAEAGAHYFYRLDDEEPLYPDPASRFQPAGPHGASQVIDPTRFTWSDQARRTVRRDDHVLYEIHLGTFTRSGTWTAAIDHLPALAALGITTIEIMPVAEFAGRFGWGYDGV